MTVAAAGVAVFAAFLFAVAAVAQQRAAADVPEAAATGFGLIARLVRRPLWWAGFVGDNGGYLAQAAALALGSLLLVQPLLVTSLVFALPLGAVWAGRRVAAGDVGWAVALTIALAVFAVSGNPTRGLTRAPFVDWLPALGILAAVVAVLLALAAARHAAARALPIAVATGILFGASSALTKSVVDLLGDGFVPLVAGWETYALAVVALSGTILQQSSYQAGALAATLPTMTVLEPVVAGLVGVTVLEETVRADGAEWALIAVSVAVMMLGTVALARSAATDSSTQGAQADGRVGDAQARAAPAPGRRQ